MAAVIKGTAKDVIRFLCEYSEFFKYIVILLCLSNRGINFTHIGKKVRFHFKAP